MFIVPLSTLPTLQPLGEPSAETTEQQGNQSFASIIRDAMDTLQQTQQQAAADCYGLAMGDVTSLHTMMINPAMEATAVETAVQLTSRAVSAYKEIMQMQI